MSENRLSLTFAAFCGDVNLVERVLSEGFMNHNNSPGSFAGVAFVTACKYIPYSYARSNTNASDASISNGHFEVVKKLLKHPKC
jgi:hypothetical protein